MNKCDICEGPADRDAEILCDDCNGNNERVYEIMTLKAHIASLEKLISPEGSKHERQLRLVLVARRMGFSRADAAYWEEDNPEAPIEEPEDLCGAIDPGETGRVDLGIFLHDGIYVTVVNEDEVDIHDDRPNPAPAGLEVPE